MEVLTPSYTYSSYDVISLINLGDSLSSMKRIYSRLLRYEEHKF